MLLELVVWFVYHGLSPFLLVKVTFRDFNREYIFCSSHVAVPRALDSSDKIVCSPSLFYPVLSHLSAQLRFAAKLLKTKKRPGTHNFITTLKQKNKKNKIDFKE